MKQRLLKFFKMIPVWVILVLFFIPGHNFALEETGNYVIGKILKLKSQVLEEDREIYVQLPEGYENSKEKYPVLYILDARRGFPIGAAMLRFFAELGQMPRMIVVGIPNISLSKRLVDFSPDNNPAYPGSGGAGKFLDFLKTELIPQIDKKYRTHPSRVLCGHSLAGLFTTYVLLHAPDTFNAYIATSPSLVWNNQSFLKTSESLVKKYPILNKFYYFSFSVEPNYAPALNKFKEILEKHAPGNFKWKFESFEDEDHGSVVVRAMHNGLRWIFSGWKYPWDSDHLKLDLVKKHYKKLSEEYGFKVTLPAGILNAMGYFWLNDKNENIKEAMPFFKYCIELYPDDAYGYHNLGYCYQQSGDKKQAIQCYEKSVQLAPENKKAAQRIKKLKKELAEEK